MKKSKIIAISSCSLPVTLAAAFFIFSGVRSAQFKKLDQATPLAFEQTSQLKLELKNKYSDEYELLKPLPYTLPEFGIEIGADSAILIDVSNGDIIYKKNADKKRQSYNISCSRGDNDCIPRRMRRTRRTANRKSRNESYAQYNRV